VAKKTFNRPFSGRAEEGEGGRALNREKLKIVFFTVYFLLAPLAGYYWNNHFWVDKIQRERGRIIEAQMEMAAQRGGVVFIPGGTYHMKGAGIPRGDYSIIGEGR
jgi:hypothetical protein